MQLRRCVGSRREFGSGGGDRVATRVEQHASSRTAIEAEVSKGCGGQQAQSAASKACAPDCGPVHALRTLGGGSMARGVLTSVCALPVSRRASSSLFSRHGESAPIYTCGNCGVAAANGRGIARLRLWNTLTESVALPKRADARTVHRASRVHPRLDASTRNCRAADDWSWANLTACSRRPRTGRRRAHRGGSRHWQIDVAAASARISRRGSTCYVTGEESLEQIGLPAQRLGGRDAPLDMSRRHASKRWSRVSGRATSGRGGRRFHPTLSARSCSRHQAP